MSVRISPRTWAAVALLATAPSVGAAPPISGENCQLGAPPPRAGDETVRAEIAKIYPRRKDFPARYTGCQTTWLQGKEGWTVLSVAYFREGVAASYWTPSMICEYRDGKAQGSRADKCPLATALPAGSMAPGCAEKILGRGGTAGCQPD